jgi:hypothetical protein
MGADISTTPPKKCFWCVHACVWCFDAQTLRWVLKQTLQPVWYGVHIHTKKECPDKLWGWGWASCPIHWPHDLFFRKVLYAMFWWCKRSKLWGSWSTASFPRKKKQGTTVTVLPTRQKRREQLQSWAEDQKSKVTYWAIWFIVVSVQSSAHLTTNISCPTWFYYSNTTQQCECRFWLVCRSKTQVEMTHV